MKIVQVGSAGEFGRVGDVVGVSPDALEIRWDDGTAERLGFPLPSQFQMLTAEAEVAPVEPPAVDGPAGAYDGGGAEPVTAQAAAAALRRLCADGSRLPKVERAAYQRSVLAGLAELGPLQTLAAQQLDVDVAVWSPCRSAAEFDAPEPVLAAAWKRLSALRRHSVGMTQTLAEPQTVGPDGAELDALRLALAAWPQRSATADTVAGGLRPEAVPDFLAAAAAVCLGVGAAGYAGDASPDPDAVIERVARVVNQIGARGGGELRGGRQTDPGDLPEGFGRILYTATDFLARRGTGAGLPSAVRLWLGFVFGHGLVTEELVRQALADLREDGVNFSRDELDDCLAQAAANAAPDDPGAAWSDAPSPDPAPDVAAAESQHSTARGAAVVEARPTLAAAAQDQVPVKQSASEVAPSAEVGDLEAGSIVAAALAAERDELVGRLTAVERELAFTRAEAEAIAQSRAKLAAEVARLRGREADWRIQLEEQAAELAAGNRAIEALRHQAQESEQHRRLLQEQGRRRDLELRQARQTQRDASQSQLRQAQLDSVGVLAAVLVDIADQAEHEQDRLGPVHALQARALSLAAQIGVEEHGVPGEVVEFDPRAHAAPGGQAPRVTVSRPGLTWRSGPEELVLEPAIVRAHE